MEFRRLMIAALLSLAVIFLWQSLFPPVPSESGPREPRGPGVEAPPPESSPRETSPALQDSELAQTEAAETSPAAGAPGTETPTTTETPAETASEPALPVEPVSSPSERRVTLETPSYRAEFTNRGAQLVSLQLKDQRNADGSPVELVHGRAEGPWPFGLIAPDGSPSPLNQALFRVERAEGGAGPTVSFRYRGSAGAAEKTFRAEPNGMVSVEVRASGEWLLLAGPMVRDLPDEELGSRFGGRKAVYRSGEEVETVDPGDLETPRTIPGAALAWVGLEDNYFLTALLPQAPIQRATIAPYLLVRGSEEGATARFEPMGSVEELTAGQQDLPRAAALWLEPRRGELELAAYMGVKRYDRLAALPGGLEQTVMPGIMGILARPLLWGLNWIFEHVVSNYGWAIVFMTLLIKLVLFPLTHKSLVSMQKMQELNPKIQAIRQKYRAKKRDKKGRPNMEAQRKMNEEVMALYKAEGVNPAGGCLPMLIQLPILFAFYRLLYSAVELRGAPWMLWIQDLSAYDPYFVLPIVMGVSQLVQQRMAPQAGNPMQRRMFMLMPVVFTVLFLKFPSGLVLYWLVNNLLTIVQQQVIRRLQAQPAEATVS